MSALLSGIVAGYGIAIPVGPITLLIVEAGLVHGFRTAFAAGAGAATADLVYATLAAACGEAIIALFGPVGPAIRIVAGLFVAALGLVGLWRTRRWVVRRAELGDREAHNAPPELTAATGATEEATRVSPFAAVYARFVGLTLLNPLTVAYFTAIVLGRGLSSLGVAPRALFVVGVAGASLSWQSLIAFGGAVAHRRLSVGVRFIADIIGNLVIVVLGVQMLIRAL